MLEEENRMFGGCSDAITDSNCKYTPQGINAAFGYNTANLASMDDDNNDDMCPEEARRRKQEMLNKIRSLKFAIVELAQYLDTHPCDKKALCLHQEYCEQLKDLTDKYQKIYGPLTIYFPCNQWRWIDEPWPWEGGMC